MATCLRSWSYCCPANRIVSNPPLPSSFKAFHPYPAIGPAHTDPVLQLCLLPPWLSLSAPPSPPQPPQHSHHPPLPGCRKRSQTLASSGMEAAGSTSTWNIVTSPRRYTIPPAPLPSVALGSDAVFEKSHVKKIGGGKMHLKFATSKSYFGPQNSSERTTYACTPIGCTCTRDVRTDMKRKHYVTRKTREPGKTRELDCQISAGKTNSRFLARV